MAKIKKTNKHNVVQKKQTSNTFSIVIANYNYANHVTAAINSALAQDYPADCFEVIVVDDGSTDNSREAIAEVVAKNPKNLRVITQSNMGQAAAFYAGVNVSKHHWICLLDSDDYFKPHKLSTLNLFINQQQANCEFICHDVDAVDEVAKTTISWFARTKITSQSLSVDEAQGGYPYSNPCGQVYKKSLLQKIAPWLNLPDWTRGADNPLVWASMFVSGQVSYLHESLAVYRIHENNFFMGSTATGLAPKMNWLERWPKLIAFLKYLHQGAASSYASTHNRAQLIVRLENFLAVWERKLSHQPDTPYVSFITTCKNRLHHLKQTLPNLVKQTNAEVIVVDYGCQQGTRDWVKQNYPQVKVIAVDDDADWCAARARNIGAAQASANWLCFIDADIRLQGDLSAWVMGSVEPGSFYLVKPLTNYSQAGTIICEKVAYIKAGQYDEACKGWFPEDSVFYADLIKSGCQEKGFNPKFLQVIEHGDNERALGERGVFNDKDQAIRVGGLYRRIKHDLADLSYKLTLEDRAKLILSLKEKLEEFEQNKTMVGAKLSISAARTLSQHDNINFNRQLIYTIKRKRYMSKYEMLSLLNDSTTE